MNILHIDTANEWRGGQRQLYELALRSPGLGVMTQSDSPLAVRLRAAGVPVFSVEFRNRLAGMWAFQKLMQRLSPQMIAAHTSPAVSYGLLAGLPVVVHRRVDFYPGFGGRYRLRAARGVIAVSQGVATIVANCGISKEKIRVVYDGVSRDRVTQSTLAWKPRLLAVGALVEHKGHEDLVRAMGLLPSPFSLDIAGVGPLENRLRQLADTLGVQDRIRFLGTIEVPSWQNYGLLIHPSREEGLGQVVIEALMAGLPVVATRVGGLPELVDTSVGELVLPRNPMALANAILQMEAKWELCSNAARIRGMQFGVGRMIEETQRAYESFLKRK